METAIVYAGLKNIDKVAPRSSEDEPCFRELKSVLQKHGKLSRFGICLLHEHFPMYKSERLVEECDPTTRVLTIRPVEVGSDKFGETIETSWRLDVENDISRPTGNCIAYCKEIDGPNGKTHHSSHKATP